MLTLPLVASVQGEAKILHYIVQNINNNTIHKILCDDAKLQENFKELGYTIVKDAKDADLIILRNKHKFSKNVKGKVFVLGYELLNEIPQSFGAFFWKKGRPNIVFIAPRVKKEHIQLSKELQEYEEEQVW